MPSSLPAPGTVIVHVIDPAAEPAEYPLSDAEEALASRFRFEKDARHWRACRTALRRILGGTLGISPAAVALRNGEHGKPFLCEPHAHLHFNLSHCRDLALLVLGTDGPLGIDLEPGDRGKSLLGCESSFCHPAELAELPTGEEARARALLDLWTSKEALLKALGTGMSLAPETIHARGKDPRLENFRLRHLEHPALAGHVARLAAPLAVETVDFAARESTARPDPWQ